MSAPQTETEKAAASVMTVRNLMAQHEGEIDDWPIPAKLRVLAALFDLADEALGIEPDGSIQATLRQAADLLSVP